MRHVDRTDDDVALFKKIAADLPILADLCRADLLLYSRSLRHAERVMLVAHAQPHSSTPLYDPMELGTRAPASSVVGLSERVRFGVVHTIAVRGATVARQVFQVQDARGRTVGYLLKDAYWLAHERQRRRSPVFQASLEELIRSVLRRDLVGAEGLASFGEHDGVMLVGADRRIQYMSGIAAELYRNLGYRDSLIGRRVGEIETVDHQMVMRALNERVCQELRIEERGLTWIRKALPIVAPDSALLGEWSRRLLRRPTSQRRVRGVFILIHDATEALRTQRELEAKMALVREVHHRVKNNLQVIASIMRMQARRAESDEARAVLEESVNRILSVAVVHEFLSQNAKGTINLKEVAYRIMAQVERGLIDPGKVIRLRVQGPDIWLPAERATQCALVTNELVQNAIEHGMARRDAGSINVALVDEGDTVGILVADDGEGLPEGFDLATNANLGLQIVRNMVERDLRGQFELTNVENGVQAQVRFAKSLTGGE
jgi:two-component sensor histidine kinase